MGRVETKNTGDKNELEHLKTLEKFNCDMCPWKKHCGPEVNIEKGFGGNRHTVVEGRFAGTIWCNQLVPIEKLCVLICYLVARMKR